MKRLSIDVAKMVATNNGGECFSTEYINSYSKLKWKCGVCSSAWSATLHNIKDQGQWCSKCAKNKRYSLSEVKKFVSLMHDGECLSKKYYNSKSYLKFRCKFGHEWKATFGRIKRAQWCPRCSKRYKNYNISDMVSLCHLFFYKKWFLVPNV